MPVSFKLHATVDLAAPATVLDGEAPGAGALRWINPDTLYCYGDIRVARLPRPGDTQIEIMVILIAETTDELATLREDLRRLAQTAARGWCYSQEHARRLQHLSSD
jgi:hypothetical protein